MAKSEHIQLVKQGSGAINAWRENRNAATLLELDHADLSDIDLKHANLGRADLRGATLTGANLNGAKLSGTDFTDAKLNYADLSKAIIYDTVFSGADLSGATFSPLQVAIQGDAQQGKTTLTKALEKQQNEASKRYLKFVDKPIQAERLDLLGASAAAVVVISAVDGIMNYADEAIKKASKKNQDNLSVFCNKMDLVDDDEDLELIMMEIENRLEDNNFPLDIKKGSALEALDGDAESINTILQLLKKVENDIALAWESPH